MAGLRHRLIKPKSRHVELRTRDRVNLDASPGQNTYAYAEPNLRPPSHVSLLSRVKAALVMMVRSAFTVIS